MIPLKLKIERIYKEEKQIYINLSLKHINKEK